MNAPQQHLSFALGQHLPEQGGWFAGVIVIDGQRYGVINVGAAGELPAQPWGEYGEDIPGAGSVCDGAANTIALAAAGHTLATAAQQLSIAGFNDWYLPSRDELELLYRTFKPTDAVNSCTFRDGENPNSVPIGQAYTERSPDQVSDATHQHGGAEAFEPAWYWASTQYSADTAWIQSFDGGSQYGVPKGSGCRARAVRRFPL
ncbi:Lcl domain-containing protein [Chitiniphilus shinanonensis]|uniref:Lcl domain-containing protein n=1 Tax=Chitiniphilus shinanonensis TaxID=553088 RepID=UPI0030291F61